MKTTGSLFEGRINRSEFFLRSIVALGLILLAIVPNFLLVIVGSWSWPRALRSGSEKLLAWPVMIIYALLYVGYILPAYVRRLHDFGKSGWWFVGVVVLDNILRNTLGAGGTQIGAIVQLAFGLFLLFWPGTKGPNKYGEVPQVDDRKLMGGYFATILVVLYLLEAALCGWIVADRQAIDPVISGDGLARLMAGLKETIT